MTFDSNAWEAVFGSDAVPGAPIRAALQDGRISGFICDAGFRIEAITKRGRPSYFKQPYMGFSGEVTTPLERGVFKVAMSMGPDDQMHPGLPSVQAAKLAHALSAGVKLMHSQNWMGLPRPPEILDTRHFVHESDVELREREERQIKVMEMIRTRGVGHAIFEAADGWTDRPRSAAEEKQLSRACAEWADGELVEAHVAYRNDILCTNDRAKTSGRSIFDEANRAWLTKCFGVKFMTLPELIARVGA